MITCPHCGQLLPDGTAFCSNCGIAMPQISPQPQQDSCNPYMQQPYGQPMQNSYGQQPQMPANPYVSGQSAPANGKAVASLILGIVSILCLCLLFAGNALYMSAAIVPGIIGLVLGIFARKDAKRVGAASPAATAGITCSIIGMGIALLMIIFIIVVAIGLVATDSTDILDNL